MVVTLLSLTLPSHLQASDFEVNGIYYRITSYSGNTCAVTSRYGGSTIFATYVGSIEIPEQVNYNGTDYAVTSIDYHAFYGCSGLTSLSIPNSVTSIGDSAFYGCSGLTSLSIPNSVTTIGNSAFQNCSGLTSLDIPNTITEICDHVFDGCSSLKVVNMPSSVTSIGFGAFASCEMLERVNITDLNAWAKIKFVISTSNPLYYAHHLYLNDVEVANLEFPESVTSIGQYSFYGCYGLTTLSIPNTVTSIGVHAFSGCSNLKEATISNSVTSIGECAFYECSDCA
jgi:hypothetical protein